MTHSVTITHYEIPPSSNTNQGVGGRGNPHAIARTKRQWEGTFGLLLMTYKVPRGLSFVRVRPRLEFATRQRRDADNYYFSISKPLGDALKVGWLPDDTPEFYQMERPEIVLGAAMPRRGVKGVLVLNIEYED